MYPVIFTQFDLHASVSARPPPATAPLEEDIGAIVLSEDQTSLGQTDVRSRFVLWSSARRHLQTLYNAV